MILADLEADLHLLMENKVILFENSVVLRVFYILCESLLLPEVISQPTC